MPSLGQTSLSELKRVGAVHCKGHALNIMPELHRVLADLPIDQAGLRLHGISGLTPFTNVTGPIGKIARAAIGPDARAVRAILFDKTDNTNWSLGWHQDRTICVESRIDTPDFGPWTMKQGLPHVAPPISVLNSMVTLRVHLDDVSQDNAPLLIAPGSHRRGRIPVQQIEEVVRECGIMPCHAQAGDIWLYATPILHASEAAKTPTRRRVLQLDYAAQHLPNGLTWAGI